MAGPFLFKGVSDLALSPRQEKFCLEYAKSGNSRQSYKKAGYKCSNDKIVDSAATRLLSNVQVQKRLAELAEMAATEEVADIQEMQKILTQIIRKTADEEVIVIEGKGEGLSKAKKMKKEPAIKDIVAAINTLGKMQGAFTTNLNIESDIPVVIAGGDKLED